MKIGELIRWGTEYLKEQNIDNAEFDSKFLMMYILKCNSAKLFMVVLDEAAKEVKAQFEEYICIRSKHYPLQYICKSQEFMGYEFYVDENVLIPRQDTEILVEEAFKAAQKLSEVKAGTNLKILDMCTGSGCIGISLSLLRKEKGHMDDITLADISEGAVSVAKRNAQALNAKVKVIKTDLFDELKDEKYDIIISNPPYIESEVIPTLMEEVREHEPLLALDGTCDGLYFYRKIIEKARTFLNENGEVLFEIGYNQYEAVRRILVANQFTEIKLIKDYAGLDRVVSGKLTDIAFQEEK